jgi:hypothetical protein
VRRRGVPDIGDGRASGARRRRHSPAHHGQLAAFAFDPNQTSIGRKSK